MNYGMKFMTLYRRQGSRPSPWKRNAKSKMALWGGLKHHITVTRSYIGRVGKVEVKHELFFDRSNPTIAVFAFTTLGAHVEDIPCTIFEIVEGTRRGVGGGKRSSIVGIKVGIF